mgnify:CR=1 FL=1
MADLRVRAIRGATTVPEDSPEAIAQRVQEVLGELLERNGITTDSVISVVFTATPDLVSAFPATAARSIGFGSVPLICAAEIDVPGAMARCVRVMAHVELPAGTEARHVYLHEAKGLRDDLPA